MLPLTARKLRDPATHGSSGRLLVVGMAISLVSAGIGYSANSPRLVSTTSAGVGTGNDAMSGSTGGDGSNVGGTDTGGTSGSSGSSGTGTTGGTGSSATGTTSGGSGSAGSTGTTGSTPPPAGTMGGPSGPPSADPCAGKLSCGTRKASDVGVTSSTIKLGYLNAETGGLSSAGVNAGVSADTGSIITAWTNEINRLGVNGRKISVVSQSFDVTDPQNMQAACKAITKDQKVFSVITPGGYDSIAQLCIAKENRTPLLSTDPEPAAWYQQAAPYLYSTFMSKDRIMLNNVKWLKASGYLRPGDKVGLIYHDVPTIAPSVEKTYLPALKAAGVTPVVIKLATDLATGLAQVSPAVNEFKREKVTFVVPVMNLIYKSSFMQTAASQNYKPRYDESDIYFGCSEFTSTSYDKNQFDRTQCLTVTDNQSYTRALKKPTAWTSYADTVYKRSFPGGYATGGKDATGQAAQKVLNYSIGQLFMLWYQAADRAGTQLTRPLWGQSMQMTGPVTNQIGYCSMSFGKGKFDGADLMSVSEYHHEESNGYLPDTFHTVRPCAKPAF